MFCLAQSSAEFAPVQPVLFYGFALLIGLSAWGIVLSANIVRMAVFLLLTLAGTAGFYFMLEAEFLAAIQLIVYAGGTLILIIFGVMLTSKNPFMQLRARPWEELIVVYVVVAISGLLLFALVLTAPKLAAFAGTQQLISSRGYDQVEMIGKNLLSTYLVPFEVAAVLLLVVMIGAAYMARRRTKE